jgi:hypothetical protein
MSSSTAPTASSASAGARKVKVAPGSHIKNITSVLNDIKGTSSPPNAARTTKTTANTGKPTLATSSAQATADNVTKTPAGGTMTRRTAPAAKPTEKPGDDFDLFGNDLPPKPKAHVPHEQSARRLSALNNPGLMPATTSKMIVKSNITTAPSNVFKSVKKSVTAEEKGYDASDYEQRLSLQRMKDDARSTLKERYNSLFEVYQQIAAVHRTKDTPAIKDSLEKSMEVLQDQIYAVKQDIEKLKLFGKGFNMSNIKGVDTKVSFPSLSYCDNVLMLSRLS